MNEQPTRSSTPAFATLTTPRGRGAVATIRFDGDCRLIDAAARRLFRAANSRPLADQPLGRVVFGRWGRKIPEEVVVCRVDERSAEIHCHGGDTAARRILDDLASAGCTVESWPETVASAGGVFAAECLQALSRAGTLRTADILLQQHSGVLRAALEGLAGEAGRWTAEDRRRLQCRLHDLLRWADFGLHLTRPWNVVLAGRPNVGKSSLINALVGYARSIVFDQPGTTRDVVTAETALEGWPLRLADTAGVREEAGPLESAGIGLARQRLADADCRLLLFDTSRPPTDDDRRLRADWPGAMFVAHKCDLADVWGDEVPDRAYRVSSITGEGIEALGRGLVARLVPEVPAVGTPIPFTERQVALLTAARDAVIEGDEAAFRQALRKAMN